MAIIIVSSVLPPVAIISKFKSHIFFIISAVFPAPETLKKSTPAYSLPLISSFSDTTVIVTGISIFSFNKLIRLFGVGLFNPPKLLEILHE